MIALGLWGAGGRVPALPGGRRLRVLILELGKGELRHLLYPGASVKSPPDACVVSAWPVPSGTAEALALAVHV